MSLGPLHVCKRLGKHISKGKWEGHEAVGGFIEAMLAIVIVTSGTILLTLSFAIVGVDITPDLTLEERCEGLMKETLHGLDDDADLMIFHSDLERVDVPYDGILDGYSLILMKIGKNDLKILASGGGEYHGGEKFCERQPVNICSSPRDVEAAVLVMWGW